MSNILVFTLHDVNGAKQLLSDIQALSGQGFGKILDGTILIHQVDDKIKIRPLPTQSHSELMGGAFWGILISLIFFMPWFRIAGTSDTHTLSSKLAEHGINTSFIKEIGSTIQRGYSALFLLTSDLDETRLVEITSQHKATLFRTKLSQEDEMKLFDTFGSSEAAAIN
jgi:uncharacterized membrane protein